MKKAKKIEEISYGVRTLRAVDPWSEAEISTIEVIQKEYKFENYNLAEKLYEKLHAIGGIRQVIKCNPNEKEQVSYIDEVLHTSSWLAELLSPGKMGAKIRKRIIGGLASGARGLEDLDELLNQINWACLQSKLEIQHESTSKPSDRSSNSHSKNNDTDNIKSQIKLKPLLRCLCELFIEGSSLQPTHGTDAYSENHGHSGNLYDFIVEILPLLKKKLGIKGGTSQVIGRYLNDVRPKRSERFD